MLRLFIATGGARKIQRRLDFSTCLFQTLHLLQMRHRALTNCFYSFALLQHVVDLIGALFDLVKFDIASGCDDATGVTMQVAVKMREAGELLQRNAPAAETRATS